jgi:L-ribulose-5-phosphate 3-epimerase
MESNRREFIKAALATAAGLALSPELMAARAYPREKPVPLCVFTKCLQFLDYGQLGETLAQAGFDGADLSVRKGGHVQPEKVKTDLPRAVKTLQQAGISVPMMVTGITNADDPDTERILGTAAGLGIKYYRLGYFKYDPAKSIPDNLAGHKKSLEKIGQLNRRYGLQGAYQNHAGTGVGGPVWDLYWLLKDSDPAYLGAQYDIRHAVCEGGVSWSLGMKLLAPWIRTTNIKDFLWQKEKDKWKIEDQPLGAGMVDFDAYLQEYVRLNLSGPVSIHYEYDLGGAEHGQTNPKMSREQIFAYLKKDLTWLKDRFNTHGIK